MGNYAKLFLALVATGQLSAPAAAQTLLPPPSSDMVKNIAAFARENITRARVSDGSNVPPETAQELARPIIPASLVRQTVARGFLTGELEACGMDWQAGSFRPYMKAIRSGRRYSDKQLAYIGILHGLAQGEGSAAVAKVGRSCTAGHIEQLQAMVRKAPVLTPKGVSSARPSGGRYLNRSTAILADPSVQKVNLDLFKQSREQSKTVMADLKAEISAYLDAHPELAKK